MKSRESLIKLHRFQVDEKRRQVAEIEAMVADFSRKADDLEKQIEAEQERAGVSDESHFAYPMFAKAAKKRRENLLASIEDLNFRLEDAKASLGEAFAELKKFELMQDREAGRMQADEDAREQADHDEVGGAMHRADALNPV